MGIELTTFEMLTMSEDSALKQRYRAEQELRANEVHVDFTTEGFEYPQKLGHLSLKTIIETPEIVLEVAA